MVYDGNQGQDDRYIPLRRHNISPPTVARSRYHRKPALIGRSWQKTEDICLINLLPTGSPSGKNKDGTVEIVVVAIVYTFLWQP